MSGLLLLMLAASCGLAYGQYNATAYYNADAYYYAYHHDEACLEKVPEGLSVPSMCFMYEYVGECEENGYNPHVLSEYLECAYEFLSEEEIEIVDQIWNSAFGPGGEQAWNICSDMGYDITYLNEYATCMEHIFGVGYSAVNEAFLGLNVTKQVPEIVWDYLNYYYYDPEESVGPKLPEDPIAQMVLLMHGISMKFLDGYNTCPYDGEYMCPDRSCIPDYWECDGWSDCDNGADEMFCGAVHDDYWWYEDDDDYYWEDDDWYWDDYDWYSDPWFTCEYLDDYDWCDGYHDCEWDEENCWYDWEENNWDDPWYTCEYLEEDQWCDDMQDCEYDEGDFCDDWDDNWGSSDSWGTSGWYSWSWYTSYNSSSNYERFW